jgi:DNA-binding response OmpR family regulator
MAENIVKLLIVEDEEEICAIVKSVFERRGYKVDIAHTGKETMQAMKEKPHLIILDRILPDVDGIDLLKEIRKTNTQVKVIIVSAENLEESAQENLNSLAVSGYLHKPVGLLTLFEAVKKVDI